MYICYPNFRFPNMPSKKSSTYWSLEVSCRCRIIYFSRRGLFGASRLGVEQQWLKTLCVLAMLHVHCNDTGGHVNPELFSKDGIRVAIGKSILHSRLSLSTVIWTFIKVLFHIYIYRILLNFNMLKTF
jgi:hypothetical protein